MNAYTERQGRPVRHQVGGPFTGPGKDLLLDAFSGAGVGLIVVNRRGMCLEVSDTASAILDIPDGLPSGFPLASYLPSTSDGTAFKEALRRAFEQREMVSIAVPLPDGRWLRAHICAQAHRAVVMVRDRTDRIRGEQAIGEAREQFRALVEGSADPSMVTQDGRVIYANPAYIDLFGIDPTGQEVSAVRQAVVVAEDIERAEAFAGALKRGEAPDRIELRCLGPGGRRIVVEAKPSRIHLNGRPADLVTMRDLTEWRELQEQLAYQALHDSLTGLPNRILLAGRLSDALSRRDGSGQLVALMVLDLNGFKHVNDSFGHGAGDRVLQQVAERFKGAVRKEDTVVRLGGDEFAVILPSIASIAEAGRAASRLLASLTEPVILDELRLYVGTSIGIAVAPDHADDADELMRLADSALYRAKREHTGFAIHNGEAGTNAADHITSARELRDAIAGAQLRLYYQPVVDPYTNQVDHLEALVRWLHPERGLVPPSEFIPLAERTGLVRPLTAWVLDEALAQVAVWRAGGLEIPVAVNISVQHLQDDDLPEQVAAALARWAVPARLLRLEVTEQGLATNLVRVQAATEELQAIGVAMAIDDFGTGQAAFGYLRSLNAREIKIDRSFVRAAAGNPCDAALVRAIIEMAGALGKTVVAEGVEDRAAMELLVTAGCDTVQGYYYSPPIEAAAVARTVRRIQAAGGDLPEAA